MQNSVIRDPKGRVKFKRLSADGADHYHIGVWIESDDPELMDRVSHVEYTLHPSFPNRERRSENRRNDFSITFWAWGRFDVEARVFVEGEAEPFRITHRLNIQLPADTGANYVDVT
ncbi:pYEATS domain-containing protein [Pseudaestuariivita atlantica]|nr:pYEATS domain-containing protein [Pseudaestuariivita atlantica]